MLSGRSVHAKRPGERVHRTIRPAGEREGGGGSDDWQVLMMRSGLHRKCTRKAARSARVVQREREGERERERERELADA